MVSVHHEQLYEYGGNNRRHASTKFWRCNVEVSINAADTLHRAAAAETMRDCPHHLAALTSWRSTAGGSCGWISLGFVVMAILVSLWLCQAISRHQSLTRRHTAPAHAVLVERKSRREPWCRDDGIANETWSSRRWAPLRQSWTQRDPRLLVAVIENDGRRWWQRREM